MYFDDTAIVESLIDKTAWLENSRMAHIAILASSYCWFSHDVTKFQTSELLILLRFYFHGVSEQLKTNIQIDFHSEWVLGLVIDYA